MTRPSSRNGTGCAISFRKIEKRWAGWERIRRKKGGNCKEGKYIRTNQKCQAQIQFWSLAYLCPSPASNSQFLWNELIQIEMRLLGWSQIQGSMTKYKSRCKFGFQMSSDLGVFRCAFWHYISNNELPEQPLSLTSGSNHFSGQAVLCNCPMLIWPLFAASIFFILYWGRSFFLSQPLSLYPSHFSALKPGGAHCREGAWPDTHWWIDEDSHIPKYT